MANVVLQVWEFGDAPPDLRRLIPEDFVGGWLALISSKDGPDFALHLVHQWSSVGMLLVQYPVEDGGIVLAGPHPASPGRV